MTDELIELNFKTLQLEVQKTQTLVTQYAAVFSDNEILKNLPEYITLKEAAKLKGVLSYETLQKKALASAMLRNQDNQTERT